MPAVIYLFNQLEYILLADINRNNINFTGLAFKKINSDYV